MRHTRLQVFVALTFLMAGTARAQTTEELKRMSLSDLVNIDVTSVSKAPVAVQRTPAAVFVITSDDIRRSGATTIPEVLRLAPGVDVARIDSSKWSIGIRGFGSRLNRSVLVLIDGRTVYTTLFAGTYWDTQDVLLEDVDRIEVIRGPGGTIWGPNAVNGVINIITKGAEDTHGLLVTAATGRLTHGLGQVRYGARKGTDIDYRVYGKAFSRGAQFHTDGSDFDEWEGGQTGFRVNWKRGDRDTVAVLGDAYKENVGERVEATSYAPPFSRIVDGDARVSGGNLTFQWTRVIDEHRDVHVQAYYDRANRSEPNFGESRSTFDADFVNRFRIRGRHAITWGLGARAIPIDTRVVTSGLTFLPLQRTDTLFTAFAQDEVSLVPQRLSATAGVKLLHTNFTTFGAEPSVRVLWTPTPKRTFWTAFTHALRTPSDAERNFHLLGFVGMSPDGTPFLARFDANPEFVSERLNGYELGYRELFGSGVAVDVTGFYNDYADLFSQDILGPPFFEPTPSPPHLLLPAEFGNGLRGTTHGVEVAPEWRPVSFVRLRGSYAYLHMDVEKGPQSRDIGTAPFVNGSSPRHEAAVQVALDFAKHFEADADVRHVSERPAQAIQAYSTANARLAWRVTPRFELSVVGRSLFQPHHAEAAGDPGPLVLIRRSVYFRVQIGR